jgi:hypothetical protein
MSLKTIIQNMRNLFALQTIFKSQQSMKNAANYAILKYSIVSLRDEDQT